MYFCTLPSVGTPRLWPFQEYRSPPGTPRTTSCYLHKRNLEREWTRELRKSCRFLENPYPDILSGLRLCSVWTGSLVVSTEEYRENGIKGNNCPRSGWDAGQTPHV